VATALYITTVTDTPYLDRTSAPLCVLPPLHRDSGCCGGPSCRHDSDVSLSPPFFLNCLFPPFLSSCFALFYIISPRVVERANYSLSRLPTLFHGSSSLTYRNISLSARCTCPHLDCLLHPSSSVLYSVIFLIIDHRMSIRKHHIKERSSHETTPKVIYPLLGNTQQT